MVEGHYPGLGFAALDDKERNLYALNVNGYKKRECCIKMENSRR
jgi:hypothetical protein